MDKKIEQIYTNCLAQGAYFIESDGVAAVIDPLRETEPYLMRAKEKGVKIKYIFETHFHADFVSGHLDLAKATGAQIIYGPLADTEYEVHNAVDGEEFKVGRLTFRAIHTPGHTLESTCYLLVDERGNEHAIFTGDTLFIGDVGRPDLSQKGAKMTQEEMAGMLFDSLRSKIMPLPDHVIVYPAHGAGSACGKNMSKETSSTIGEQKATNYALQPSKSRDTFIHELTHDLDAPPAYFAENALLNKNGYEPLETVINRGNKALSPTKFKELISDPEVLLLDVRCMQNFANSHIPGALFIGLDGSFAPWVGAIVTDIDQKIALVAPENREEEAILRLARVGFDRVIGYLDGGIMAWQNADQEVTKLTIIPIEDLPAHQAEHEDTAIYDVRKPGEFTGAHLNGAVNMPLSQIADGTLSRLAQENPALLHCQGGYRATVASSILLRNGVTNLTTAQGDFKKLKDHPLVTSNQAGG